VYHAIPGLDLVACRLGVGQSTVEDLQRPRKLVVKVSFAAFVAHLGWVEFALDDAGALFGAGMIEDGFVFEFDGGFIFDFDDFALFACRRWPYWRGRFTFGCHCGSVVLAGGYCRKAWWCWPPVGDVGGNGKYGIGKGDETWNNAILTVDGVLFVPVQGACAGASFLMGDGRCSMVISSPKSHQIRDRT
jgi:hypothetical protein